MDTSVARKPRPKYLNARAILFEIRLPLSAWVSILHRASGVMLFGSVAWLLYALDLSLASEQGFKSAVQHLSTPLSRLLLLVLLWAFCHHFFAGIRFLLLDLDVGTDRRNARLSSAGVLAISLAATGLFGWRLW